MNDWICTDPSCNQYRQTVVENCIYRFREDRIVSYKEGLPIIKVYKEEIDVRDYTEDEIQSCLASFGYTRQVKGIYYDTEGHVVPTEIVAECIFELSEEGNYE